MTKYFKLVIASRIMNVDLTLKEIASILEGTLDGNPDFKVERIWPVKSAQEHDLSFYYNPKYKQDLKNSHAGAWLVSEDTAIEHANVIRVQNPNRAINTLAELLAEKNPEWPAEIHPSAQIDPGVHIYPKVKIGKNVRIKSGAVIGSPGFGFEKEGEIWKAVPQMGSVVIEDNVYIGSNTCVDRARIGETYIGQGTKIDNLCQIGHGSHIGQNCLICGCCGLAGSVTLGDSVILAGAVGVADNISICSGATLGGSSGVMRNIVEPGAYWGMGPIPKTRALECLKIYHQLPDFIAQFSRTGSVSTQGLEAQ
jgi:UDP-3-O-[3-hydroxymyristoyl] glucosamine N-acyltransferase